MAVFLTKFSLKRLKTGQVDILLSQSSVINFQFSIFNVQCSVFNV